MPRRHPPPRLILATLLAIMLVVSGCRTGAAPAAEDAANAGGATPMPQGADSGSPPIAADDVAGTTDDAPRAAATDGADSPTTATAAALPASCADLPLRRKAALVLVVGIPDVTEPSAPLVDDLVDLGVGGVFLTGYNVTSRDQVTALIDALHRGAAPAPLIVTDEERGRVSSFRDLLGATSSPRTLAATRTPGEVRADARQLGRALRGLDVDWTFAPLADIDGGPSDGVIGDRAFGATPQVAGRYARAFAAGLDRAGIIATAKHFPGHGAVATDVDPHSRKVPSNVTPGQLRRRHLPPFERLIADDVPVVMLNHVTYRALDRDRPASLSPAAYRLLRDTGFDGVAITDSIGMGAVHRRWKFPVAAEEAIGAGADAVLATDGRQARRMRDRLVDAVRSGRVTEARLDEAVARTLVLRDDPTPCDAGS